MRDAQEGDEAFLRRMLLLAAYWRPGAEPPPGAPDEELGRYIEGWGREGDAGVVAEADGRPVGAGWFRLFSTDRPGHGFVAPDVPELALAVEDGWRGRGAGTRLLEALIELGTRLGMPGLSLSVNLENPALELYRRHGFETVRPQGATVAMLLRLRPD